jgi:lipid-A-disaccharide synthase-like uncharacterized protein
MLQRLIQEITAEPIWGTIGFFGQAVFGSRFILQWIVSEYKKKSHIPTAFWFISLLGSIILLVYSIHREEPVFILGFSLNTFIYLRNIHLIYSNSKAGRAESISQEND